MLRVSSVAVAVAAVFFAGSASANLLANGDFEVDLADITSGNYTLVTAANSSLIDNWTLLSGNVDISKAPPGSTITGVAIDLVGTQAGTIQTSFTAMAGYTYTLTFDQKKNGNGSTAVVTLGGASKTFTPVGMAIAGVSQGAAAVKNETLSWKADATGMQFLTFASGIKNLGGGAGPQNGGMLIDNLVLTAAVPEPGTYAMLLAGLAAVGFVVKRRSA